MKEEELAMLQGFVDKHSSEADAVLALVANEIDEYSVEAFTAGSNKESIDSLKKVFVYECIGNARKSDKECSRTFEQEVTDIQVMQFREDFVKWFFEHVTLASAGCYVSIRQGEDVYNALYGDPTGISLVSGFAIENYSNLIKQ